MGWGCGPRGCCPGEETPITPDEPDVLDGGDGVEGLGAGGWRRVRRVRRVVCGFRIRDQAINRPEQSHETTRARERGMRRLKSAG